MRHILYLLLSTAPLYAGAGESHGPLELFWKGFNILLFLGIVYWIGKKPIGEAFNNFFKSLTEKIENSEKELEKAKAELQKAKEELEKAKVRADESVALAQESAKAEIEKAKQHAEEIALRIKEKAKETLEIELKKAKQELALYGMLKAEEVAREMLKDTFKNAEMQRRYIEKQLKTLEEKKNA